MVGRINLMPVKKRATPYLLLAPSLIILVLVVIYPLCNVIMMSFFDANNKFVGLDNYFKLFKDAIFYKAFFNTVKFTAMTVIFHFVMGMGLALLLNQKTNTNFFRGIIIIPWLLPSIVVAMLWILIYNPFGVLNGLLKSLGLLSNFKTIAWLGSPSTSLLSVTVTNIWKGYPFVTIMFLSGLQAIPGELYEAGKIDGASPVKAFFYITLPNLRGVVLTTLVLDGIWSFRLFDLIFSMTGGGPINSSEVMATHIYNTAFRLFKPGYASAEGVIMFLILLPISLYYARQIRLDY